MTVLDQDLVAAIESTLHFYPPVPGLTEDLGVPGVQGRVTSLSHPLANLVGMARLDDKTADAAIARVKRRYEPGRKAYGWVVGPNSTPRDLGSRLDSAGIGRAGDGTAGMAIIDLDIGIAPNPSIEVREIKAREVIPHAEMMGKAYGLPTPVAALFARLLAAETGIRTRSYFAYLGSQEPVAWSYLVYLPNSPIVLLGGAATLPEHRGHGTYTALVKRRLDDARADGREAAVIQADRDTSAPICAKLGFRELCSLDFHVWSPPET